MKLSRLLFLTFLILTTACSQNLDVVSKGPLQKRKHRSGFHVNAKLHQFANQQRVKNDPGGTEHTAPVAVAEPPIDTTIDSTSGAFSLKPFENVASAKEFRQVYRSRKSEVKENVSWSIQRKFSRTEEVDPDLDTRKVPAAAFVALASGLIGLIIAGIILGTVALILGIIATTKSINQADRFKGAGWGIAAIILGIVDIIGALIFVALMA